jgi:hypothetical protein
MLVTTLVALGRGTHNTHTHTHTHTHTPSCCLTCTRLAVPYRETVIEISTGSLPSSRSAVAERMASICRQPGTHQQQVQRSLAVPQPRFGALQIQGQGCGLQDLQTGRHISSRFRGHWQCHKHVCGLHNIRDRVTVCRICRQADTSAAGSEVTGGATRVGLARTVCIHCV